MSFPAKTSPAKISPGLFLGWEEERNELPFSSDEVMWPRKSTVNTYCQCLLIGLLICVITPEDSALHKAPGGRCDLRRQSMNYGLSSCSHLELNFFPSEQSWQQFLTFHTSTAKKVSPGCRNELEKGCGKLMKLPDCLSQWQSLDQRGLPIPTGPTAFESLDLWHMVGSENLK